MSTIGRRNQRRTGALLATAGAAIALGASLGGTAAAHTGQVAATCEGLTYRFDDYVAGANITVTVNGQVVRSSTFGPSTSGSVTSAPWDPTRANSWSVVVDAADDPGPSASDGLMWDVSYSGTEAPCVEATTTAAPTTAAPTSTAATTTAPPTTAAAATTAVATTVASAGPMPAATTPPTTVGRASAGPVPNAGAAAVLPETGPASASPAALGAALAAVGTALILLARRPHARD